MTGETKTAAALLKIIEQLGQRTSRNVLQSGGRGIATVAKGSKHGGLQMRLLLILERSQESAVGAAKSSYGALLVNEEQRVAAWTKAEPALCHCYPVTLRIWR